MQNRTKTCVKDQDFIANQKGKEKALNSNKKKDAYLSIIRVNKDGDKPKNKRQVYLLQGNWTFC